MDRTPGADEAAGRHGQKPGRRTFLRTTGALGAAAAGGSITGVAGGSARAANRPRSIGLDWEAGIPDVHGYPTLRELHRGVRAVRRDHPQRTELRTVGRSRAGRDILMISVGAGRNNALVLGGPHPNEPTGFLTALHLARLGARHPELAEGLDVTWHIVPCMDPDAMRLGEKWYDGPHTIQNYYGKFYRPAFRNQVEWTFPVEGGFDDPLPETRALMALIDDLKPKLVYTLHSSDFTGFHFMTNRNIPELVSGMERAIAKRGFPFHAAPADGGATPLGRGSFLLAEPEPSVPGEQMVHGVSSIHYAAARHGALGVLPETPMWHCPRFEETDGSGHRYDRLLGRTADRLEHDGDILAETVRHTRGSLPASSPYAISVAEHLRLAELTARAYRRMATEPTAVREATVAERFALLWMAYSLPLRAGGMLLQLLEGPGVDARHARRRLRTWFVRRCSQMQRDFPGHGLDLRELAAVQIDVAFTAARCL
ncbi:M14 family zinc carboxypeptidase [Streptomyces yaizuensis]|uniref:3-hydroxyacyl-CoA dehydrogenase n=1 Tax=Streptomyces yaizuensis TaxID=2989713 RepID=A0ABQ5NRE3_9ACTN|nr:M14 family zinc carboxypeptidase [Streptomyces sp. YSPA8]GLF92827.1 3-hydroxyacyl-CoA dehydrogenase [Streptomyces sp. YSPA8]